VLVCACVFVAYLPLLHLFVPTAGAPTSLQSNATSFFSPCGDNKPNCTFSTVQYWWKPLSNGATAVRGRSAVLRLLCHRAAHVGRVPRRGGCTS
jgi:hypothetical protein